MSETLLFHLMAIACAVICAGCAMWAVSILHDIRHALVTLVELKRGWP